MGHIGEAGGAVVIGCRVLPTLSENGMVDGAMKKIAHGKKAVARVKELLKRAAEARPQHGATTTAATTWKKWKNAMSFQARDSDVVATTPATKAGDDSMSKLSFKWDDVSRSSASSALYSPLSVMSKTPSRLSSMSHLRFSSSVPFSPGARDEEQLRTAQWITTDSDFVVLEL